MFDCLSIALVAMVGPHYSMLQLFCKKDDFSFALHKYDFTKLDFRGAMRLFSKSDKWTFSSWCLVLLFKIF
jgi:hypothetical protein